jgi:hypothetical protein
VAVALTTSKPSRAMLAAELPAGDGHRHRRRAQKSPRRSGAEAGAGCPSRGAHVASQSFSVAQPPTAEIAELETYDDEEHRAVFETVEQGQRWIARERRKARRSRSA